MLLAPLFAAMIYPFGSLWVKQGQALGAGPWRIAVIGNLIITLCFLTLLVLRPELPNWNFIGWPIMAGTCFFCGQFLTVLALKHGDVSMVAPMMGCKTLFVALYSSLLGVEMLGVTLWVAAALTAVAIFLLGWRSKSEVSQWPVGVNPPTEKPRSPWLSVILALSSAAVFAGVDTIFSHAGKSYGRIPMLVTAMLFMGLLSLMLIPIARVERPLGKGRLAIVRGNIAYGIQATILNFANVFLAQPTVVNIIYSARGLFGITHTWLMGHHFENQERHEVHATVMIRRCFGALLLMLAIVLVVVS